MAIKEDDWGGEGDMLGSWEQCSWMLDMHCQIQFSFPRDNSVQSAKQQ